MTCSPMITVGVHVQDDIVLISPGIDLQISQSNMYRKTCVKVQPGLVDFSFRLKYT